MYLSLSLGGECSPAPAQVVEYLVQAVRFHVLEHVVADDEVGGRKGRERAPEDDWTNWTDLTTQ